MNKERSLQPVMNAILVFESAARLGSFSRAARALGTSQPSVSRHIANLEDQLGCRLFDRKNNRIALTPPGQLLFAAARDGTDAIFGAISECRRREAAKVVTIGCTHGFSHLWIMPRFSRLQALFPDREIRIVTSGQNSAFDPEEIDFSVRYCREGSDAPGTTLFEEEVVPVAAPGLLPDWQAASPGERAGWLLQQPLLHLDDGEEGWVTWRDWFAGHGVDYSPAAGTYFFRNYAFSLQAAAEGKGVALAWRQLLGPYQESGWLSVLGPAPMRTKGCYRLIHLPKWAEHEAGRRLIAWFRAETGVEAGG